MALDNDLLEEAKRARDQAIDRQLDAERAQVNYQHSIRRLHASGGSLREIADTLGLSHQRVHQIVETVTGKTALKESRDERACSFCGSAGTDSDKLIAGPGVFICDDCVSRAERVIRDGAAVGDGRPAMTPISDGKTRCSFCGRRARKAGPVAAAFGFEPAGRTKYRGPGVRICGDCLGLCAEILGSSSTWKGRGG